LKANRHEKAPASFFVLYRQEPNRFKLSAFIVNQSKKPKARLAKKRVVYYILALSDIIFFK
jgi:hypothetical protein